MPATMQTLTNVLKERYEGKLNKQLNSDVTTLKRIERSSKGVSSEVGGKYVTFPIHTRRNSGIGARNEAEALPPAGQQGTAAGRVALKYLYGSMELTGQSFELANTDPQTFIEAVDLESDGLKDDLAKDLNRQVYGDGTGAIGVVSVLGTTVNTVTVSNPQYFWLDMQVDVVQTNGTVVAADRKVTAIDEATGVITLSGAAFSSAVGQLVVRTGNWSREWTGLAKIVSNTGSLYNIDPAVEPVWKSTVDANGGSARALSELLMISTYNKVRKQGGKTTVIFTSPGVWASYFALLSQQRQFVNTKEFTGGFSGLAFATEQGEVPVVQDFDAPKGTMYMLNEDDIKLYRTHDWQFMNRDGNMWQRKITSSGNFDAYYATLYQYSELGIKRRNSHAVIKDITEVA